MCSHFIYLVKVGKRVCWSVGVENRKCETIKLYEPAVQTVSSILLDVILIYIYQMDAFLLVFVDLQCAVLTVGDNNFSPALS